ncbi:MAG TPA: TolC family outer membrane protein [Burkholderiaceae bacterium]|nr:TolC family outer membrane protein [Burkholderiaceae bacterium]
MRRAPRMVPGIARWVASMLLVIAPPAFAEGTDLLTLTREALVNDPTYSAARFAQLAAIEAVPQARANLLPNVNASLSESANRVDYRSTNDALEPSYEKTFNSWGPALNFTLPVYSAPLWENLTQAKLSVKQSEARLAQARAELLLRVAQAYFDVLAAQDALTALRENKKAVSEQLAQAKREFEAGTKTIVDTHEAKARYDQIDAQEQVARADLAVKQSALRAIIGHDAGELKALRDPVRLEPPRPNDVDTWAHDAEDANYSVVAARASAEIARHETRRARDAYLPSVNLTGGVQYQRSTGNIYLPVGNNTTASNLGITLTVPVFTGGAIQSQVREALAHESRADEDLELARRTAAQTARQAYTGVDYGLAQVQALESAEVSAKTQLDSTRLGYQVGVRINLDVLNANTQLFNTQRDLKKARYDFLVSGLKLKAAAGDLQDEDVQTVNALLQK